LNITKLSRRITLRTKQTMIEGLHE